MQQFRTAEDARPSFEETYPRHPFAPLVAMGLALGAWLHRQHHERVEDAQRAQAAEPDSSGPEARAT
jgi:hypothetical protein